MQQSEIKKKSLFHRMKSRDKLKEGGPVHFEEKAADGLRGFLHVQFGVLSGAPTTAVPYVQLSRLDAAGKKVNVYKSEPTRTLQWAVTCRLNVADVYAEGLEVAVMSSKGKELLGRKLFRSIGYFVSSYSSQQTPTFDLLDAKVLLLPQLTPGWRHGPHLGHHLSL